MVNLPRRLHLHWLLRRPPLHLLSHLRLDLVGLHLLLVVVGGVVVVIHPAVVAPARELLEARVEPVLLLLAPLTDRASRSCLSPKVLVCLWRLPLH